MKEIIIQGVDKTFGDVQALKAINLRIPVGSFTTILGPSGCGKTTLLRLIAGLEAPDAGEIRIDEEIILSGSHKNSHSEHHRNFGMVFQDFALWPHLTVFENIAFGLRASKQKKNLRTRVQKALRSAKLEGLELRFPHQLSGGQQQRVAFARVVVTRPQLVLFDEPLSAQDVVLREKMRLELISLVKNMGITAIYVTHDQTEALSISDRVVVMQEGTILQAGSPEEIYCAPKHPFVAQFIGKTNWIVPDKQLLRPEHLRWSREDASLLSYTGTVQYVSYRGDRYEVILDMEEKGTWTAYHNQRLPVGEKIKLYAFEHHIHHLN